jgi:hypothetical protein
MYFMQRVESTRSLGAPVVTDNNESHFKVTADAAVRGARMKELLGGCFEKTRS